MPASNVAAEKRSQPQILVETAGLSEEEWLAYRRKGIGGSDVAALLGISPWRTARDLYFDKLNIVAVEDNEDNWVALEMGHLLEPLVAKIFQHRTGYKVYQIKKMFQHPQYSWMLADVDYFVELPDGSTAILEIKTTNYNARDNWWLNGEETVPVYYETQGRHYADEDYLVIAPQNTFDIIKEGRMLHHCVGNDGAGERYYDRIERRESFIMFLRRAEEPEDPYYTLEIEPDGTVRQKRTLFDRQHEDIEQATEFLQKWQKVIAARLTGQDLKLAEQSRVLRNEEFIQMKKDRVVIHTGHLAGHLLADVLLADLMENKEVVQQQELPAAA